MLNLKEAMSENNTESFLRLCSKRIIDANLVDGKMVLIDINHPDNLYITADGLLLCQEILEGYIDEKNIRKYMEDMLSLRSVFRGINDQANYLKRQSKTLLWAIATDKEMVNVKPERREEIKTLVKEELKARSIPATISRKVRYLRDRIGLVWCYRRVYLFAMLHPEILKKN